MRVVVCTVVHHPADARIFYREIQALLDAGHDVTYIAPHGERARTSACFDRPRFGAPGPVRTAPAFPAPRSAPGGPARGTCAPSPFPGPWAGAGSARCAPRRPRWPPRRRGADLLLVHDPELLLVLPPRRKRPPTVWDVHEDTAAALTTKAWLPAWLRPAAAGGVALRRAARRAAAAPDPRRARLQRPLRRHPPGGAQHDVRPRKRRLRRPARAASSTSAGSPRTAARPRWWSSAGCWRRTASRWS